MLTWVAASVYLGCAIRCESPLAFAAMLAAGLDGIEKGLTPPPPVNEDVYLFDQRDLDEPAIGTLPGTLAEALDALEQDEVIQDALDQAITDVFVRAKRAEWGAYRIQVTHWELERLTTEGMESSIRRRAW